MAHLVTAGAGHPRQPNLAPTNLTKKSKSEGTIKDTANPQYRPLTNTSAVQNHYDGIFNGRGSNSMRHTPANTHAASAQFYGFEVRNIKKNPGGTGHRDSAQAIEERLSNLGQNPIVSLHSYNRNKH